MAVAKKDPAAVALGRKGGKIGGPARAAKLTRERRSEIARRAVQARWAKPKAGGGKIAIEKQKMGIKKLSLLRAGENSESAPTTVLDTSKKALHLCLKRIKAAKNENDLRRLTEQLQRIVFHKQYQNAQD
jgi:hypothetical protein